MTLKLLVGAPDHDGEVPKQPRAAITRSFVPVLVADPLEAVSGDDEVDDPGTPPVPSVVDQAPENSAVTRLSAVSVLVMLTCTALPKLDDVTGAFHISTSPTDDPSCCLASVHVAPVWVMLLTVWAINVPVTARYSKFPLVGVEPKVAVTDEAADAVPTACWIREGVPKHGPGRSARRRLMRERLPMRGPCLTRRSPGSSWPTRWRRAGTPRYRELPERSATVPR